MLPSVEKIPAYTILNYQSFASKHKGKIEINQHLLIIKISNRKNKLNLSNYIERKVLVITILIITND